MCGVLSPSLSPTPSRLWLSSTCLDQCFFQLPSRLWALLSSLISAFPTEWGHTLTPFGPWPHIPSVSPPAPSRDSETGGLGATPSVAGTELVKTSPQRRQKVSLQQLRFHAGISPSFTRWNPNTHFCWDSDEPWKPPRAWLASAHVWNMSGRCFQRTYATGK